MAASAACSIVTEAIALCLGFKQALDRADMLAAHAKDLTTLPGRAAVSESACLLDTCS